MNIKYFLIYIIILFFNSNCSYNNYQKSKSSTNYNIEYEYFDNGRIKSKLSYLNSKLEGESLFYDSTGVLRITSNYIDGLLDGNTLKYDEQGRILYSISFIRGMKHGKEVFYYNNGEKKSQVFYEYDKEVSEIIRWDINGKVIP